MNLHENKDAFAAAIQLASASKEEGGLGIKQIYLEKDYWICRSLKLLSECPESEVAVFKGGTSLSKAYHLGNRFSEDIDIAITSDPQRTENQTKNIISRISKAMSAFAPEQIGMLETIVIIGKGDNLIAGYNTSSAEEKAKVNIKRLLVGGALIVMSPALPLCFKTRKQHTGTTPQQYRKMI